MFGSEAQVEGCLFTV